MASPANAEWLRCGGTWFAGVNVLSNNHQGVVNDSGPLQGKAVNFIREQLGISEFDWDKGQVSVCYPGYPQPMPSETPAAYRYRRDRDAAHVDGLLPVGDRRRRHLREHHGFILGLPLIEFDPGASPFVVWEGSHHRIRDAFRKRFAGVSPATWESEDVTEIYQQTRRGVFDHCARVEVAVRPGEAFVVHRLTLHGVARWAERARAGQDGRMILYFRPTFGSPVNWLNDP